MGEITKLYENAGIKPIKQGYCDWNSDCPYPDIINNGCGDECPYWKYEDEAKYPPFTAEKVIRLLEWEANRGIIDIKHSQTGYQIFTYIHTGNYGKSIIDAVANYFCVKWQDLTEEEKQQIKEIVE